MCCLLKYVIGFLHLFFFQTYSMAVYLVKQLSSTVLLQRLRAKGIRNPDHSRALSTYDKLTSYMQLNYLVKVRVVFFSQLKF